MTEPGFTFCFWFAVVCKEKKKMKKPSRTEANENRQIGRKGKGVTIGKISSGFTGVRQHPPAANSVLSVVCGVKHWIDKGGEAQRGSAVCLASSAGRAG